MAGRSRVPAYVIQHRDEPPPLYLGRAHPAGLLPHPAALMEDPHLRRLPLHPHPSILAMEEHMAAQHREIQALLVDNQRLAATHVALKQELTAVQHNFRLAAAGAVKAKDERDAEVREVYERSVKAEAEVMAIEGMRAELAQVQSDVQKLRAAREELIQRLHGLREELELTRAELKRTPEIRAEIEAMHKEIQRGRAAVEYEKKAHASNLELSETMEKNMISMARDIEKLRSELANAEKRARAAAAAAPAANPGPGYGGTYGNSEMAYGGTTYGDAYSMQQAQRGADGGSQYGTRGADGGPQYGTRNADSGPQYGTRGADGGPQYGTRVADGGPQYGTRGADGGPQYGSVVSRGGAYDIQQTHAPR